MDLKLSGRRVLITGGSKGIGEACARIFLAGGAMRMGSYGALDPMSAAMRPGANPHSTH